MVHLSFVVIALGYALNWNNVRLNFPLFFYYIHSKSLNAMPRHGLLDV